jgi:hypothetical protein
MPADERPGCAGGPSRSVRLVSDADVAGLERVELVDAGLRLAQR